MKKFIFAAVVFIIVFLVVILPLIINTVGSTDFYKMGDDIVPSIKSVVGERKLSGAETAVINSINTKKYTYTKIESPQTDIKEYFQYLMDNEGFEALSTSNRGDVNKIIRKSVDEGYIIVVSIEMHRQGYTIILQKGKGGM